MAEYNYELKFEHFSRGFGDFEEVTAPATVKVWRDACKVLNTKEYETEDGTIKIDIDWSSIARREQDLNEYDKLLPEQFMAYMDNIEEYIKPFIVKATITDQKEKIDVKSYFGPYETYLEHFLYEVFLLVNLACPGGCDFYSLTLSYKPEIKTGVKLSQYIFEWAWTESLKRGWPLVECLSLESVKNWYCKSKLQNNMVASNAIESALIALLHICSQKQLTPATVIWLSHGLEGMLDTRIGESFNSLLRRIQLLIDIPVRYKKALKKNLREFYDIRSAFVHGGHRVAHPLSAESLDNSQEKYHRRLMEASDFTTTIYISIIQELIKRNWSEIEFHEKVIGV